MIATLTTKFDVGDTVWFATHITETKQHPCPDCLGSKKWEARSPAGGVFPVPCPRCTMSYLGNHKLNLTYPSAKSHVIKLTVGQVEFSSNGPKYMCLETGIGSGSVYLERDLFLTKSEAVTDASIKAANINVNPDLSFRKQYDETVKFSDYHLESAAIAIAEQRERTARYLALQLLDDIKSADSIAEVREVVRDFEGREQP